MTISVILPNFNHADKLARALRALLRQKPDEILLVDDASTDASISIAEEIRRENPTIHIVRHPHNRGAAAALNTGLALAKGDFVYCAASDDFVLDDFFSRAVDALQRNPTAAYYCGRVVLIDRNGAIVDFRPLLSPSPANRFVSAEEACRLIGKMDNWAVGQSVVYRREALAGLGGFDESLGSFCDGINYRVLALRHGFYFSDDLVAAWEISSDSLSARSAISPSESSRMLSAAQDRIATSIPASLKEEYPALFSRRLRFNMARLSLSSADREANIDFVGSSKLDRAVISLLGTSTRLSRALILTWLLLRLRPFGFFALVDAWIKRTFTDPSRRKLAVKLITVATE